MKPARHRQLAYLDDAKHDLLAWAGVHAIPLVHVEFVTPLIDTDYTTSVWLFYDTDANAARCADIGVTANVQEKFLSILSDKGYPAAWIADTSFVVDSHENVERNFEGSYFYRLR